MLIPIQIDFSELSQEFTLSENEVHSLVSSSLNKIVDLFHQKLWTHLSELKKTREAYKNGLEFYSKGYNVREVVLVGFLPNAIESGLSPFDMKLGFQRSKKRHPKKGGGWYLTIPFRFAASTSLGESPMFSSKMPEEIHKIAKQLKKGESLTKGKIPTPFDQPGRREQIATNKKIYSTYVHKSSIFEGMIKSNQPKHEHYKTFRRVSDLSDPESWIHKGLKPRNFFGKTLNEITPIIPSLVDETIDKFLIARGH